MTYITIEKEKVMLALEALNDAWGYGSQRLDDKLTKVIKALEEALPSEQEQRSDRAIADSEQLGEPVANINPYELVRAAFHAGIKNDFKTLDICEKQVEQFLNTTPPQGEARGLSQQQRTPLTDEHRLKIAHRAANFDWVGEYLDAVEFVIDQYGAAHGITEENT